jgi:hypothetical protein
MSFSANVIQEPASCDPKPLASIGFGSLNDNMMIFAPSASPSSAFRPHRPPYARPSDSKRIALSVALSNGTLDQKRQATEIK